MRKPRVFVPRIDPEIVLTGREAHHLLHVLRVRPGREVVVFDGAGLEAEARVLHAGGGAVRLAAGEPRAVRREPPLTPVLYLALLKGDKLADLVVLVLISGMPAAVNTYLMAAEFGGDAARTARVVVLSTLISFLTLPLVLGWALRAAGVG